MHSSYQLNTVFTDVYLLLLQNYKLAQVATWLTSRYSYGTTLLWIQFSTEHQAAAQDLYPEPQPDAKKQDRLCGRKEADWATSLSTTRLYWRDRSKPHSLFYTRKPSAAILLHIVFHFQISYRWKLSRLIPPKTDCRMRSWRIIMCNWEATYSYIGSKYRPHCRQGRWVEKGTKEKN